MEHREVEKRYRCVDDCVFSGCPSHLMKLVQSDEGAVQVTVDDKPATIAVMDDNELDTLCELWQQLKESWK